MSELLWLLLPVAAASGWFLARRDLRRRGGSSLPALSPEYYRGLNYLLNEQPDKAIEVFVRMLEVDSETVEIHLALGNLFRLRGEVDRAIRVHQNLIARPTLSKTQRCQALLELGQDYMKAGLFDRAESLFVELIEMDTHAPRALQLLSDIYQQEKEWDKAVAVARKLQAATGESQDQRIAHFYCEMAEQARARQEPDEARRLLKRALASDPGCVRASLIRGEIAAEGGDCREAVATYRRVERQDPAYLSEVIQPLVACYRQRGRARALKAYLQDLQERRGGITTLLALVDLVQEERGDEEALRYLKTRLRGHASLRGLSRLLDLEFERTPPQEQDSFVILKETLDVMVEQKPIYRCMNCGFTGRSLHWRCPGCKSWSTVKPIQGVEGE